MKLSEEVKALDALGKELQRIARGIDDRLDRAKSDWATWPDHQMVPGAEWHDRSETPPDGMIWASDGTSVWIIRGDGKPIPSSATAVKFWTRAYIPAPPDFTPRVSTPSPNEIECGWCKRIMPEPEFKKHLCLGTIICRIFDHPMRSDVPNDISGPSTCKRCGHKEPGITWPRRPGPQVGRE